MQDAPAKIVALAFYVPAAASLFADWPPLLETVLQIGTVILFVVHALEVIVCFRWVRMYEGPWTDGVGPSS